MIDKAVSYSQLNLFKKTQFFPESGLSSKCVHRDDENKKIEQMLTEKRAFVVKMWYERLTGNIQTLIYSSVSSILKSC